MRRVSIELASGSVDGVFAAPESGTGPGVIVIQEWWGLVPHIAEVVQRLADEGFVALAVDHYRGAQTTEPDVARKQMMGLSIPQIAEDLAAAADWLAARDEVTGSSIGVVGFCMGGGLALLAPTVSDKISAAVAFYPATPWPDYQPNWTQYRGKRAIVHKAESDEEGMGATIADIAAKVQAAGGEVSLIEYPGSLHAFFNDARPEVYQPEHAQSAWQTSLAFLRSM